MLQILALYNYLLITKMTDLNYFVRKKIYVQALKKSSKMTLNFQSSISNQVLVSLRRKKRVWMKLVSFKQHEKNETQSTNGAEQQTDISNTRSKLNS